MHVEYVCKAANAKFCYHIENRILFLCVCIYGELLDNLPFYTIKASLKQLYFHIDSVFDIYGIKQK